MKQDNSFIGLLDAMWQRQCALLMMQVNIEDDDFERAMEDQFEYLYWMDEVKRLWPKHEDKYFDLIWAGTGLRIIGQR
jgi:hypothetical protein